MASALSNHVSNRGNKRNVLSKIYNLVCLKEGVGSRAPFVCFSVQTLAEPKRCCETKERQELTKACLCVSAKVCLFGCGNAFCNDKKS